MPLSKATYIHASTHQRWSQPCKATDNSPGAVRVMCLPQHITPWVTRVWTSNLPVTNQPGAVRVSASRSGTPAHSSTGTVDRTGNLPGYKSTRSTAVELSRPPVSEAFERTDQRPSIRHGDARAFSTLADVAEGEQEEQEGHINSLARSENRTPSALFPCHGS